MLKPLYSFFAYIKAVLYNIQGTPRALTIFQFRFHSGSKITNMRKEKDDQE